MKIYVLTINQVDADPPLMISSFRAKRTECKVEYWQTREAADRRKAEIYDATKKLLGHFNGVEVVVTEAEVLS